MSGRKKPRQGDMTYIAATDSECTLQTAERVKFVSTTITPIKCTRQLVVNEGLNGDASVTHCDPIVTSTPKEMKETQRLGGRLEIYSQTVCTNSYEIENIRMDFISVIKFT